MSLLLPNILFLEINYLVLYFVWWRIQFLHGIVNLRHPINLEILLQGGYCFSDWLVLSAEGLYDRVANTKHFAGHWLWDDSHKWPLFPFKNHVGPYNAALSDLIKSIIQFITVRKHNINEARLHEVNVLALLTDFKQLLALLKKLMLCTIVKFPYYVKVCISQELHIVLT